MFKLLDCGRKPENPGREHADSTCNKSPMRSIDYARSLAKSVYITDGVQSTDGVLHLFRKLRNGQLYLLPSGDVFHSPVRRKILNSINNKMKSGVSFKSFHILLCLPDSEWVTANVPEVQQREYS